MQLVTSAPDPEQQLAVLYDADTRTAMLSKVMAFRAMHLHGRSLQTLVPKAVDNVDDYLWLDGEIVAGMVIGWNFGEGHLSNEALLTAVQAQCGFEAGELRCIFVEPQPTHRWEVTWRIADAAAGPIAEGIQPVRELLEGQAWPTLEEWERAVAAAGS